MHNEHVSERLTAARAQITMIEKAMSEARTELRGASVENDKINAKKMRASHIDAGRCYAMLSDKWGRVEEWCPHKGKNDGLCGVHDKGWARASRDQERQGKVVT